MTPTYAIKAAVRYRYYVSANLIHGDKQNAATLRAIATGREWLAELVAAKVTGAKKIAAREKCSVRQVNRIINLAFLAPDLVQAAVDGRLPRGIGVETLRSCPLDRHEQRVALGLAS